MKFAWLVGRRHLVSRRSRMLSVVSVITILGVAFGVMALLVTLAVINGFRQEYERSVLAFNAHLVVMGDERLGDMTKVREAIQTQVVPDELQGMTSFLYREGLGVSGNQVRGLVIKVVDLEKYWELSGIHHQAVGDVATGLWVGKILHKDLQLAEKSLRLRLPGLKHGQEEASFVEIPVSGLFSSGMYDYDVSFALIDREVAARWLNISDEVSGLELWLKHPNLASDVKSRLSEHISFPYTILTWQELNANLFGALQLERLVFGIIMGILILVASFNIAGTLTMRILEKRGDIAILRAMGATWGKIRRLFFFQGLMLGWAGSALGIGLGVLALEILMRYRPLKLAAEIYFVDFVPARWQGGHILVVVLVTTLFSWLATQVALLRLKRLSIMQALGEV